jgi:hypothetical protein
MKDEILTAGYILLVFMSAVFITKTYTFNRLRTDLQNNGITIWNDGRGNLTSISITTNNAYWAYMPDEYCKPLTNCGQYLYWELKK